MRDCACCGGRLELPPDPVFDDARARINLGEGHHHEQRKVPPQSWWLLEVLRAHKGRRLSRDYLLSMLPGQPSPKALDVYVSRARHALQGTPFEIATPYGLGIALIRRGTP